MRVLLLIGCLCAAAAFRPLMLRSAPRLSVPREREIDDSYLDLNESKAPLKQLQIRFSCDAVNSEELSELLFECGVLSVSVEGESENPDVLNDERRWGDLQKTKSWATALLRANFPSSFDAAGLSEILAAAYPGQAFEMEVIPVADKDWVSEVQQSWKPQVINDLTIRFPWHAPGECTTSLQLVLEGGAAFGTGDHPTTRLCTRWLSSRISSGLNDKGGGKGRPPITVLDYGCGSAILGLAALRYGADAAVGVDIDADALCSAKNNSVLNGLDMGLYLASEGDEDSDEDKDGNASARSQVRAVAMNTLRSSTEAFPLVEQLLATNQQYSLVVANILAPILIMLAPTLAGFTRPGGYIALSGLVAKQAPAVMAAFSAYFEDVGVHEEEEDWVCIAGRKKVEKVGEGEGEGVGAAVEGEEGESDSWNEFLKARQERAC